MSANEDASNCRVELIVAEGKWNVDEMESSGNWSRWIMKLKVWEFEEEEKNDDVDA